MDKLDETLLNGIDRYFNYLSNFGKSTKDQKNALLIFLHIKQILESSMDLYITESDYRVIENVLYCLYGKSCLLDYNTFKNGNSLFDNIGLDIFGRHNAKIFRDKLSYHFSRVEC